MPSRLAFQIALGIAAITMSACLDVSGCWGGDDVTPNTPDASGAGGGCTGVFANGPCDPGTTCSYPLPADECGNPGACPLDMICAPLGCIDPDGGGLCEGWVCTCDSNGGGYSCALDCQTGCDGSCPCAPPRTGTPGCTSGCEFGGGTVGVCECGQWVCNGPDCPPPLPGGVQCIDGGGDAAVRDALADSPDAADAEGANGEADAGADAPSDG